MLLGVLHCIPDQDDPAAIVAQVPDRRLTHARPGPLPWVPSRYRSRAR
jgi:hypothetical protein